MKKVKGLNSHRDVSYSIGNIVNNIVIPVCDVGGTTLIRGDHLVSYINV